MSVFFSYSLQLESGQYVEYTTAAYESGRQKVHN